MQLSQMQMVSRVQQRFGARLEKRRMTAASLTAMRVTMEAEQRSRPIRASLLKTQPLHCTQLVNTAQFLGIDPFTQQKFMWVASAAACDTGMNMALPVGWTAHDAPVGSNLRTYYFNALFGVSQWEHPALTQWRSVMHELQAMGRGDMPKLDPSAAGHATGDAIVPDSTPLWVDIDDPRNIV